MTSPPHVAAPRVLTIAGLDPCGGAGLVADSRAIAACGGVPLAVPACLTVQNRHGFTAARALPVDELRAMLDAVRGDGPVHAVKTGLLLEAELVAAVAMWLDGFEEPPPLVVDPVSSITAGGGGDRVATWVGALRDELILRGAVLTPNAGELERLVPGGDARALLRQGATGVLVTGGHAGDAEHAADVLYDAGGVVDFTRPRLRRGPVHGTGCALSAALATALGRGVTLRVAAREAGDRVAAWLAATPEDPSGRPEPLAIGAPST